MTWVHVEWMDGDGNTRQAERAFEWPAGLELPRPGDLLAWKAGGVVAGSSEVVGREWNLAAGGLVALLLTCDLGAYSGARLAADGG